MIGLYKVYGATGHRQRETFGRSSAYDFSEDGKMRFITVLNADSTGTHDYTIVQIISDSPDDELCGQITDGIFENSTVGRVEKLVEIEPHINEYREFNPFTGRFV